MKRRRDARLDDGAWRCPPGWGKAVRAAEQDIAAGGRGNRIIPVTGGSALASVALRCKRDSQRIYAYIRWSDKGRTIERYIGEVDQDTRARNLALAWRQATQRGLVSLGGAVEHPTPVPWASSAAVRAVMRANKGRDTRPELAVRSAVHALGLRYRIGVRPIPGIRRTADLVFPGAKVAVFVDGCFWHGCPEHHRPARRNPEFWRAKIEGNVARDADTDAQLKQAGWQVIRVWEHESPATAATAIQMLVRERQTAR